LNRTDKTNLIKQTELSLKSNRTLNELQIKNFSYSPTYNLQIRSRRTEPLELLLTLNNSDASKQQIHGM
jgi:hypothetical protein